MTNSASGSSCLGLSSCEGNCIVFFGKTLYSHSAFWGGEGGWGWGKE